MDNDRDRFHAFLKRESKIRAVATVIGFVSIAIGIGAFAYATYEANERADKAEAALKVAEEKYWAKHIEMNEGWIKEYEFIEYANEFGFCDPRPMAKYMENCEDAFEWNRQLNLDNMECEVRVGDCEEREGKDAIKFSDRLNAADERQYELQRELAWFKIGLCHCRELYCD